MRDIMVIALNKETNEEEIVFLDDVIHELSQWHWGYELMPHYWGRTIESRLRKIESRLNDGEILETDTHEYRKITMPPNKIS